MGLGKKTINIETRLQNIILETSKSIHDYIEILYVDTISKNKEINKEVTTSLIEQYLKKRGYTMNYILNRSVLIKGFTCVFISYNYLEVWHDIPNSRSFFIKKSLLTNLPILLNYMEKI